MGIEPGRHQAWARVEPLSAPSSNHRVIRKFRPQCQFLNCLFIMPTAPNINPPRLAMSHTPLCTFSWIISDSYLIETTVCRWYQSLDFGLKVICVIIYRKHKRPSKYFCHLEACHNVCSLCVMWLKLVLSSLLSYLVSHFTVLKRVFLF